MSSFRVLRVGILGAAGYTGGEMLRVLLYHPFVQICFAHSKSSVGKKVYTVHKDLFGSTELVFTDELDLEIDVLFLCVGHGESRAFLTSNQVPEHLKIIDLSQDFRTETAFGNKHFVYGLPELFTEAIQKASYLANPGCFATAIQLGLAPLLHKGFEGLITCVGITGSTGAGQSLQATSHFSWRANNLSAYKTLTHQHLNEVNIHLSKVHPTSGYQPVIRFVPWRGAFTRGIFVSSVLDTKIPKQEVIEYYQQFYKGAAFTFVSTQSIDLKQVVGTNKCLLHLEKEGDTLVIHSIIDNLLKGASGQAVQNMNLMCSLPETSGLLFKSIGL